MPTWEEVYRLLSSAGDHLVWPVIGASIDGLLAAVNSKWLQRVLEKYANITKKTWKIPRSVYIIIFGISLLVALALAWLDQYRTAHTLGTEKITLADTIKAKDDRIEDLKKKNEDLLASLLQRQTPQNSPRLQIYLGDKLVHGATFKVDVNKNGLFTLEPISIRNVGGSDAQDFRIRMNFSHRVVDLGSCWVGVDKPERGYRSQFYLPGPGCFIPHSIVAGETWVGFSIMGTFAGTIPLKLNVRIAVYYSGQQKPEVANFIIQT